MSTTVFYGATTAATCTLTTLANGSGRECSYITNTASKAPDYACIITLKTTTGTHGSDLACYAHFYGSLDATSFDYPLTGTDAAVTVGTNMNLKGPIVINFGTSVTGLIQQKKVIGSVAAIFGGNIPPFFGVMIENKTNLAFSATAADHSIIFLPISDTQ